MQLTADVCVTVACIGLPATGTGRLQPREDSHTRLVAGGTQPTVSVTVVPTAGVAALTVMLQSDAMGAQVSV
jgi:hypothetical protein